MISINIANKSGRSIFNWRSPEWFDAALIFIMIVLAIFYFSSCKKEEVKPNCKTCDVNVEYKHTDRATGHTQTDNYIESSTQYCDGSWTSVDGAISNHGGTNTQYSYYNYHRTTSCH